MTLNMSGRFAPPSAPPAALGVPIIGRKRSIEMPDVPPIPGHVLCPGADGVGMGMRTILGVLADAMLNPQFAAALSVLMSACQATDEGVRIDQQKLVLAAGLMREAEVSFTQLLHPSQG